MPGKPDKPFESSLNFAAVVDAVRQVHAYSEGVVNRVVNTSEIVRSATGQSRTSGVLLVERLSYTHLELLETTP